MRVYKVDNTPTIFYNIRGSIARGAIVRDDLSLVDCWVCKEGNYFAHGTTLKEAFQSVTAKAILNLTAEERCNKFLERFSEHSKKYPAIELFQWHHILTGSCEFGLREFCRSRNIDLDTDTFTISEFCNLTREQYGGDTIKMLENMLQSAEEH